MSAEPDVEISMGAHEIVRRPNRLEGITFDVPKGKVTVLLGPSGTGKSVFLKHLVGLLKPDRGEIWIDGKNVPALSERELYQVRRKFGVLFQDGAPVRFDEHLIQRGLSSARAHEEARERDQGHRRRSSRWSD